MAEVGDHELELVQIGCVMQEIEQRNRVRAAGDRHEGPAPGQPQLGQVPTEVREQRHQVSSTSRTLRERSPGMNGFCKNGDPGRSRPRRRMSSSV